MKKRKTKADKIATARIQSAIYGYQIPMMSIPPLYRAMEAAVAAGKTQEELRAVVAGFPGVKESAI
jgi:hypothetical protein